MPRYNYKCPVEGCPFTRGIITSRPMTEDEAELLKKREERGALNCIYHKVKMVRDFNFGPSSQVKEVLDNGFMAKQVERYADAEKVYDDHSKTPKDQ